jgi:ABC-2 type transport system permease protein
VVLGKFFGALSFYVTMVSVTLVYGLLFEAFGDPDWPTILWAAAGLVLFGGVLLGIGLFASSLTRNQVVAYIVAFVVVLFLFLVGDFAALAGGVTAKIGRFLGIQEHYQSFVKGKLDTRDILYFMSLSALFLFLTVRIVESRRWK